MSLPWNEPISSITPLEIIYMYIIFQIIIFVLYRILKIKFDFEIREEILRELKEIRQLLSGELQLSAKNVVVHVNDTLTEYDTEEYK